MSTTATTATNDVNHSSIKRSIGLHVVEDNVIEPVKKRMYWFSAASGVLDFIVPVELTSSWYKHIGM